MTILEADHIQKRFAEKMVLMDISFLDFWDRQGQEKQR